MVLYLGLVAAGCSDTTTGPSDTRPPLEPNPTIFDAAHSGNVPGFYFLPPMVPDPQASGTADSQLEPTVEICALGTNLVSCSSTQPQGFPIVIPFGVDGVRYQDDYYQADWKTSDYQLDDAVFYRITIRVGARVLGFADVDVVDKGNQLKNVETGEYIPLKDGRTLPIKVRAETGILGSIEITPLEATTAPFGSQGFTALAKDLHGAPLAALPLSWSVSATDLISLDHATTTTDASGFSSVVATSTGPDGVAEVRVDAQGIDASGTLTIEGSVTWIDIAPGAYAACGLDADGKAYCWGDGSRGELGNGTFSTSSVPVPVDAPLPFVDIAQTRSHVCGLTAAGEGFCWGDNSYGQLGDGTTQNRTSPARMLPNATFAQIAPGADHTCALRTNGEVICWGRNDFGQLGVGNTTNSIVPQVVGLAGSVLQLESAHNATCALMDSRDIYCWGYNPYGNLGIGNTALVVATPKKVVGGHAFAQVEAAIWGGCYLTTSATAYCAGLGRDGTLGDGTNTFAQPVPTQVVGGAIFREVSAGGDSNCAITTTGEPVCWGRGIGVGYGSTTHVNVPTPVAGGLTAVVIRAAGSYGCLIDDQAELYCWGDAGNGRLGDGTTIDRLTPVRVVDP